MDKVSAENQSKYTVKSFFKDFQGALIVGVILIPQSLAYSVLAGLEPVYGLYASIIPLVIYAVLGTSRFLSIGPVAIVCILLFAGASEYANPGTPEYLKIVLLLSLLSGFIQVILSIVRLGRLSNFLSKPVIQGFISAAAIIIISSQIPVLFGIELPRSTSLIELFRSMIGKLRLLNPATLSIGSTTLILGLALRYWNKRIPGALIIVILGIAASVLFNLEQKGVSLIGVLPGGLPTFDYSFLDTSLFFNLMPAAFVIALVCFILSYSIAKSFEDDQSSDIVANRELLTLGIAKLISCFFSGMAPSASFARSAASNDSKVATRFSNILLAIILVVVLIFFNGIFYFLPYSVLAAVIIFTVIGLVKFQYGYKLYKRDLRDFYIFLLTFLLTLAFGIIKGLLIGIGLSLVSVLKRVANPHYAILGRLPGTSDFRNVRRFNEAQTFKDVIIFRYDQDLFFGNSEHFEKVLKQLMLDSPDLKLLILHMGSIQTLDSTGIEAIDMLVNFAIQKGIKIKFAYVSGPLRDIFHQNGFYKRLAQNAFNLNIEDALKDDSFANRNTLSQRYTSQIFEK